MYLFVFLICKISALLTFTEVSFINQADQSSRLAFTLVDENFEVVKIEKQLFADINPIVFAYTSRKLLFTGSFVVDFLIADANDHFLVISCDGCEIFTTITIHSEKLSNDVISITPKDTYMNAYNQIDIQYSSTDNAKLSMVYLVNKEIFYYSIVSNDTVSVIFYKSGEKRLIFYFTDSSYSYIDGIVINIPKISYNAIEFFNTFPVSYTTPLEFIFSAYLDEEMFIPVTENCDVTLSLSPDVTISGITTTKLTNGAATYSNLLTETFGTYKVLVNGTCVEAFESEEFITITGVNSITISLNTIYIKKGIENNITVNYLGPLNSIININTLVDLDSSNIDMIGTTSVYGSSSKAIFYITFDNVGETTLSAFTDIDLKTVDSKHLDVYILESMCLEKVSDSCVECVPLANLVNGACICGDLSYNVDVHCECVDGYVEDQNQCVLECFNVFLESEVLGYYSEDYKSVYIVFSSNVVESSENDCSSYVTLPNSISSLLINCLWRNSKTMQLVFNSLLDGNELTVVIDNTLTPVDERCFDTANPLNITILPSELLKPTINLSWPPFVYLLCDDSNITIENTQDNSNYKYQWSANPSNYKLDLLIDYVYESKLEIPLNYFKEGSMNITCEATNTIYNTYANETITIIVTNEKHLGLKFNLPDKVSFFTQDTIFIQGLIQCGENKDATFTWEYLSTTPLDFDTIISNSPYSNSLLIPSYTLYPRNNYSFKLTATIESESLSESNTINIIIKPNDLSIKLSKNSGIISKTQDLIISATITDPDSPNSEITIKWTCFENIVQCKNSAGGLLEFYEDNGKIIVGKDSLRDGILYNFTVTAKTLDKENNESVEFYVDGLAQGELNIMYNEDYSYENIDIYGIATGINVKMFKWEIKPSISAKLKTIYSFISIPRVFLLPDKDYNISLTVSPVSGNPLIVYMILTQPKTPECQSPVIEFLDRFWIIRENLCVSDNYSLKYQFGCINYSNNTLWLTIDDFMSSINMLFPSECENAIVEVCNGPSCVITKSSIPDGVKLYEDVLSDFFDDTAEDIQIPNAAIFYSSMITTQDDWQSIFMKMSSFFKSLTPTKGITNVFITSLNSIVFPTKLISQDRANSILDFTRYMMSSYRYILTTSQLSAISAVAAKLLGIIDLDVLSPIIRSIMSIYFQRALPDGSPMIENSNMVIYGIKVLGATPIAELDISVGENSLKIPSSIILNSDLVYEIEYFIYPLVNREVKFEVSFYTSGTYSNNNLNITTQKTIQLDSDIIYATIKGNFLDNIKYKCAYLLPDQTWSSNGCTISDLTNGKITMALSHQSTFKIYEIGSNSLIEIGVGPIVTSCAWLMITILSIIAFYIIDKNNEPKNENKYTFYPITSIFIRQCYGKRVSSMIYLFSTHILLMCLIGLLFQISVSPTDSTESKNATFNIRIFYPGVIAWILTQIFSLPVYFFLFSNKTSIKCIKITKLIALSLSFIGLIGIILMAVFYCRQFTFYWTIDYFIFLLLQLMIELSFAYFMWKRQISNSNIPSSKCMPEIENLNFSNKEDESYLFEKKQSRVLEKNISFGSSTAEFSSLVQKSQTIANDKIQSLNSKILESNTFEKKLYSIENGNEPDLEPDLEIVDKILSRPNKKSFSIDKVHSFNSNIKETPIFSNMFQPIEIDKLFADQSDSVEIIEE